MPSKYEQLKEQIAKKYRDQGEAEERLKELPPMLCGEFIKQVGIPQENCVWGIYAADHSLNKNEYQFVNCQLEFDLIVTIPVAEGIIFTHPIKCTASMNETQYLVNVDGKNRNYVVEYVPKLHTDHLAYLIDRLERSLVDAVETHTGKF